MEKKIAFYLIKKALFVLPFALAILSPMPIISAGVALAHGEPYTAYMKVWFAIYAGLSVAGTTIAALCFLGENFDDLKGRWTEEEQAEPKPGDWKS